MYLTFVVSPRPEKQSTVGSVGRSRPGRIYCADRRSIAYQKKIERSRMKTPIQSRTIGTKGLTFNTSCDSSVAIAPDLRQACHAPPDPATLLLRPEEVGNGALGIVEHAIFGEDLVNRRASTRGVVLTEDVVK